MNQLTFNPVLGHITTFGGHPVNCVSALENLKILTEGTLLKEVEKKGELFEKIISHPAIVEIRRIGLFFAIEMKNADIVQDVVLKCKDRGVLSFWFLSNPQSFRIAPPLIITEKEIKETAKIINQVIEEVTNK